MVVKNIVKVFFPAIKNLFFCQSPVCFHQHWEEELILMWFDHRQFLMHYKNLSWPCKQLDLIRLLTQPCVLYLMQYLLYLFPDVAVCSLFGDGCRVIEKGSVEMVFIFLQFLKVNIIFIQPILVLTSGNACHFNGHSIDGISKACPVCLNIELRPRHSRLLSISVVNNSLTVVLEPGDIQLLGGPLCPVVACKVGFWCCVLRLSVSGPSDSLHHTWPLWLMSCLSLCLTIT